MQHVSNFFQNTKAACLAKAAASLQEEIFFTSWLLKTSGCDWAPTCIHKAAALHAPLGTLPLQVPGESCMTNADKKSLLEQQGGALVCDF